MATDDAGTGTALVRSEDINALMASRDWQPLKNGIRFRLTEDGALADPGKQAIFGVRDAKGNEDGGLVGSLSVFDTAFGWWAGDTANAIQILYGEEEVAHFAERLGKEIGYVGQLQSISRSYGFPKTAEELKENGMKMEELRVDGLSHAHHQVVQGLKEPQRGKELRRALKLGLSKGELRRRYQELSGKSQSADDKEEYPVWHLDLRAYDPTRDNAEQYIGECQQTIKEEFPYYIDPARAEEREAEAAKNKAVDGLPDDLKSETLTKGAALNATEFKTLASQVKGLHANYTAVEKIFTKGVKNEERRDEMLEKIKTDGKAITTMTAEDARNAVKQYKLDMKDKEKEEKTIEQLVAKIKNEDVRKTLLQRASDENLTKEQFEPLVLDAIATEMQQEEREKLEEQMKEKLNPDKFKEAAAKKLAPKVPKPKAASDTAGLPLGKKSGTKKAGGPKKSKK